MHHYLSWKLLNVWSLTTDNEGNTGKVCHLWLSLVFVFAESSSLTCVQVAVSREGLSALVHFPHILLSTEPKIENRPCQDGATAVGKKLLQPHQALTDHRLFSEQDCFLPPRNLLNYIVLG